MIGSIKGQIEFLDIDYCIINNNDIGYRVFMPTMNLAQLSLGQTLKVFTYMSVREDAILLYGFVNQEYYRLFLQLIAVSGVGPKVALGILSAVRPEEFYLAIQTRDLKVLIKLPGIGKKTAERLLLELKDKVGSVMGEENTAFTDNRAAVTNTQVDEAIEALAALGYSNSEIIPALKEISNCNELRTEDIIRQALKVIARR